MKLSTKIKNLLKLIKIKLLKLIKIKTYFLSVFFFQNQDWKLGCDLSSHAYSLYMSVKSVWQIEQMCRVTFLSNLIH